MKKILLSLLTILMLVPLSLTGTILAEEPPPPTHPEVSTSFGSWNTTSFNTWSMDLNTWRRASYYTNLHIDVEGQSDEILYDIALTLSSSRNSNVYFCYPGAGFVSPLTLRPGLRRMIVAGLYTDLGEQGSGYAIFYIGLFRFRFARGGVMSGIYGPIIIITRDPDTGSLELIHKNTRLGWVPSL